MQLPLFINRRRILLSIVRSQLRTEYLRSFCRNSPQDARSHPSIRTALAESADENVAEDSIRHLCENGLVKIVSSLQP